MNYYCVDLMYSGDFIYNGIYHYRVVKRTDAAFCGEVIGIIHLLCLKLYLLQCPLQIEIVENECWWYH